MRNLNQTEIQAIFGGGMIEAAVGGALLTYGLWATYDVATGRSEKAIHPKNVSLTLALGALVGYTGAYLSAFNLFLA